MIYYLMVRLTTRNKKIMKFHQVKQLIKQNNENKYGQDF